MSPRRWWLRRTLRFRITVVATGVALLCLLAFTGLAPALIGLIQITAVDQELAKAEPRLLDVSGVPVDGGPPLPLTAQDIRMLKSGEPVLRLEGESAQRWRGRVVFGGDGTPRLEVFGSTLLGYEKANTLGTRWLAVAAVLVAGLVGIATWLAVRSSLRPVERMRVAAGELPHGERLPVPPSRDELQALAEALNALLARRDEASDRLRRFTGDAAHELRSPVASVRAQAEVAVAHPDPDFSIEVLESVVEESIRLSALVDSLLILARADTGAPPRAEAVDLVLEAEAAIGRLDTELLVRLNAPPSACLVRASRSEVELVLDNLMRNAARYAYSTITVTLAPVGRDVRLLVDDDGHGIPVEHRAKVFDRFYRVEEDRGRRSGGFGLGLALVAHLVQRRDGSVRAAESPAGGARLEIRWPSW
ncbi:signal transduction histidine kinase [Lentzea atacamensis]|uniref:histidine kinase n=1 Tax=Lentzea atacamensis TaxID=531938 RepID=A0A316IG95_9PSEU|nr:ATP-binding protein [Lentzea atacamensis]PWK91616.1 signal transduction histidine kinase [Lentzea atacamensis]RAS63820.1 signal transduction histidine kinase [Lentzea atacamensis]